MGRPGSARARRATPTGPAPIARRVAVGALFPALALFLALSLLALALLATRPAAADPSEATADLDAVAEERLWRALLHQARHRLGRRARASLRDAGFFLHPDGGRDPKAELLATIEAMGGGDDAARAARCRFPARHRFLARRDLVPGTRGACPELDAWRERIGPVRLTLVFPEAFLGNPSSMFGHTLLRFDPEGLDPDVPGEALLGWTLDYTADPGDDPLPVYLTKGLFGGYLGRFGLAPYYEKIRVYSDWQDRDIWEYPLGLSPEAVEDVLLHVWEMRDGGLPYVFFTRNCSEYLLEMLEIGWPGLGRGGGFPPAVTPVDTLRAMAAMSPDAVGAPRLRPSPATRLQDALARLEPAAADRIEALAAGRLAPGDDAFETAPVEARARALSLAHDLLRHRAQAGRVDREVARSRSNALLRARARLRIPPEPPRPLAHVERVPPHEGHRTARVALGAGVQDRDAFVELRGLPAFHTLLDAPGGFAEGGEIRFLETAARYYPELRRVRLHELVLLDVTTASPWRRPFRPLAWHTDLGLRTRMISRERGDGLEARAFFRLQGGAGAALAPRPRLLLYGFGGFALEASPSIEGNAAIAPLARAGASWSTRGGRLTFRAEGLAGGFLGRDPSEWLRGQLDARVGLARDWSLVLGGHFERAYDVGHFEGRLSLVRYF